jgi:hypothetical protein
MSWSPAVSGDAAPQALQLLSTSPSVASVFVSNIPLNLGDAELVKVFEKFGAVVDASVR